MKHFVGFAYLAVFALSLTSPAVAMEVGTMFGVSRLAQDDESSTFVALPAAVLSEVVGLPSLYIYGFWTEQLALGQEFSFGTISDVDGDKVTSIFLGPRVTYYPQDHAMSGLYFTGQGVFRNLWGPWWGSTKKRYGAGPGLGYQWRRGEALVLRAEVRYRRWFMDEFTEEISLVLGLGARG